MFYLFHSFYTNTSYKIEDIAEELDRIYDSICIERMNKIEHDPEVGLSFLGYGESSAGNDIFCDYEILSLIDYKNIISETNWEEVKKYDQLDTDVFWITPEEIQGEINERQFNEDEVKWRQGFWTDFEFELINENPFHTILVTFNETKNEQVCEKVEVDEQEIIYPFEGINREWLDENCNPNVLEKGWLCGESYIIEVKN